MKFKGFGIINLHVRWFTCIHLHGRLMARRKLFIKCNIFSDLQVVRLRMVRSSWTWRHKIPTSFSHLVFSSIPAILPPCLRLLRLNRCQFFLPGATHSLNIGSHWNVDLEQPRLFWTCTVYIKGGNKKKLFFKDKKTFDDYQLAIFSLKSSNWLSFQLVSIFL